MRVRKASKYLTTLSKSLKKIQLFQICSSKILWVSPLLDRIHHLPINCPENRVDNEEEKQLSADELVQRTLPLEEKPGEASCCGWGHVPLIRDCHLSTFVALLQKITRSRIGELFLVSASLLQLFCSVVDVESWLRAANGNLSMFHPSGLL